MDRLARFKYILDIIRGLRDAPEIFRYKLPFSEFIRTQNGGHVSRHPLYGAGRNLQTPRRTRRFPLFVDNGTNREGLKGHPNFNQPNGEDFRTRPGQLRLWEKSGAQSPKTRSLPRPSDRKATVDNWRVPQKRDNWRAPELAYLQCIRNNPFPAYNPERACCAYLPDMLFLRCRRGEPSSKK